MAVGHCRDYVERGRVLTQRIRTWLVEHESLLLLAIAFTAFRLVAILTLRHGGYLVEQPPDNVHYFEIGRLAGSGQIPLINYWVEYPPLAPWLAVVAYRLSLHIPPIGQPIFVFNLIFRLLLLPFDVATLALVYASASQLRGQHDGLRVAVLWALLSAPLLTLLGWFEPLPLFFLVLGLYGLLSERAWLAGVAAGLGFMSKVFPAVLVPVALLALPGARKRVEYLAAAALSAGIVVLPPLLVAPHYVLATFGSALNRSSWETVWALWEGYTRYGEVAPLAGRTDPSSAFALVHPATLPWLPITILFAVLYLFVITRRIHWKDRARLAAMALFSLAFFLLYSKGYSPQWAAYIGTLSMIVIPGWRGLGYALLFDTLMMAEWPLAFVVMEGQGWFLATVVVLRTAVTVLLGLDSLGRAFDGTVWQWLRRFAMPAALGVSVVTALAVVRPATQAYAESRLRAEPLAPLVRALRDGQYRGDPVVIVQPELLERLQPYLPTGVLHLFPSSGGRAWADMDRWLAETLGAYNRAWLLYDTADDAQRSLGDQAQGWFEAHALPNQQTWYGQVRAGRYVIAPVGPEEGTDVAFAGGLRLLGVALPNVSCRPGSAVGVRLRWLAQARLSADYAVSVQVLSEQGRLVAQADVWPQPATSQWQAGASVSTRYGLLLPPDLQAGTYVVQASLYDAGGNRLRLISGQDAARLGELVVE